MSATASRGSRGVDQRKNVGGEKTKETLRVENRESTDDRPRFLQSVYNLLGETLSRLQQYAEAERWFQASLASQPDHVPAHITYGKLLARNVSSCQFHVGSLSPEYGLQFLQLYRAPLSNRYRKIPRNLATEIADGRLQIREKMVNREFVRNRVSYNLQARGLLFRVFFAVMRSRIKPKHERGNAAKFLASNMKRLRGGRR